MLLSIFAICIKFLKKGNSADFDVELKTICSMHISLCATIELANISYLYAREFITNQ